MPTYRAGFLLVALLFLSLASHAELAAALASGDAESPTTLDPILLDGFDGGMTCAWNVVTGIVESCPTTIGVVQSGGSFGRANFSGVYLTAFSADHKHFWAADALVGAQWNGVYFYRGVGAAVLDGTFQIGVPLDVDGAVTEFDVSPPGETFTEILAGTALVTGSPGATTPLTGVGVLTLASLANGEPYEGVLVQVSTVKVIASGASDQLTLQDNSGNTVVMDDLAYDYAGASYPIGTCFSTVTGIMHVDGLNNVRILLPRSAVDLVTGFGCV